MTESIDDSMPGNPLSVDGVGLKKNAKEAFERNSRHLQHRLDMYRSL